MAKTIPNFKLNNRDNRSKLKPRHEPYWQEIHKGLALGYRRGKNNQAGKWQARKKSDDRKYDYCTIGTADDYEDPNNAEIFSFEQAQKKAIEFGDAETSSTSYTVEDAINDYLDWFRINSKSYDETQSTINAHILPKFRKKLVSELKYSQLKTWHQNLATAPIRQRGKDGKPKPVEVDLNDTEALRRRKATANRILTVFKAVLNHAYKEIDGIKSDAAWRKVKPYKNIDKPKIEYLNEKECTRLINACPKDFRDIVQAALLTGCRYGEIIRMKPHHLDTSAGTITVMESKSGKVRHVALTEEGQKFFQRATVDKGRDDLLFTRSGEPWAKSHQSRPMLQACKNANINPPVSFHILRHTYGSLLALKGVPLQIIAAALGHSDTRMTERHYAHLMPSHVADTIRSNLPAFGVVTDNVEAI
ncbi:MAG: site-specific integrase [Gammaproteobacteria bacterium]|nr:site-specific integrase [Gammaproteobacteria bacterium]MDH5803482.1 site-specific integrase [Gammaproteobacteria bacterium]